MKRLVVVILSIYLMGCNGDESPAKSENGFHVNNKFHETQYAYYRNSGSDKDYVFYFSSYGIQGGEFTVSDSSKWNLFGFSDLTLKNTGEFVGEYFYDNTESIPGGIDQYFCFINKVNHSSRIEDSSGSVTVNILSKSGNNFEIEYEASFLNGPTLTGLYKGEVRLME